MTKTLLPIAALLASATALLAAEAPETAYTALRTVGKQSGAEVLNHVVEVGGRFGSPAPSVWVVTVSDPKARGGVREMEVSKGKIVGDRTPLSGLPKTAMDFNRLNLDSDGVFTLVDQEAKKTKVPFDRVDYTLHSGSRNGAPVWHVEILDGRNGRTGTLDIAADSGSILHSEFTKPHQEVARDDHAFLYDTPTAKQKKKDFGDEIVQGTGKFFGDVKHHFERRGRQFENFFTGRGFTDHASEPEQRSQGRD